MRLRRIIGGIIFATLLGGGAVAAYAVEDNGITATFSGGKNSQGFYTSPVTVSFAGSDGETCSPTETEVSGSNRTETVSSTCGPPDDPTQSRTGTFEVSVDDPPPFNPPNEITREADIPAEPGFPGGASIEKPSAGSATVTCDPAWPGRFPIGSDAWTCVATDDTTGVSSDSQRITVTVRDTTPPVIQPSNPPDVVLEAQGPHGFQSATGAYNPMIFAARDAIDGEVGVFCSPLPESNFALDRSEVVTCTATDAHNQSDSVRFNVLVRDTVAPLLNVTPPVRVQAESAAGTSRTHDCIAKFLREGASATDDVDQSVTIAHEAVPDTFPIGTTEVRFTANDDSTDSPAAIASGSVIVRRGPQNECIVDPDPPRSPSRARARSLNRRVVLTWRNPGARDFDHVVILRSRATADAKRYRVFRGPGQRFVDNRVRNNIQYRYELMSVDWNENRSNGTTLFARPHRILLLRPSEGARIARPPTFRWVNVRRARYYNLQLYRVLSGNKLRKILSVWPSAEAYTLRSTWRYAGRRQSLSPGRYYWYVWPGFGSPTSGNYGDAMGPSDFTKVRRR